MNAGLFGLPPAVVEKIRGVLGTHPRVERALIYGSRAKGSHKPGSDIDLTLIGDGLEHRELLEIQDELDELLLPYTIDLSLFGAIRHTGLREHIQRVGREFFRRAETGHLVPPV